MANMASENWAGSETAITAPDSALLLLFYGTHRVIETLQTLLVEALALSTFQNIKSTITHSTPDQQYWTKLFPAPGSPDTYILQCALNQAAPAPSSWDFLRTILETALPLAQMPRPELWGYTAVYRAIIEASIPLEDTNLIGTLVPQAIAFHAQASSLDSQPYPYSAVRDEVPGGFLYWVEHAPDTMVRNGTVYVAFSHEQGKDMLERWITSTTSIFLKTDLVTHKAHYLQAQLQQAQNQSSFEQVVNQLTTATNRLQVHQQSRSHIDSQLSVITHLQSQLVRSLPSLHSLYLSLEKQKFNHALYAQDMEHSQIYKMQGSQINAVSREVELLLEEGRDLLSLSSTNVELVRASVDRIQSLQTERLQWLLGLVALAVSLPQVFDRQIIRTLLEVLGLSPWLPDVSEVSLLLIQLILIFGIMLVISFLIYGLSTFSTRR